MLSLSEFSLEPRGCHHVLREVKARLWVDGPIKVMQVRSLLVGSAFFFFSSRRRHTISVSAFLLNRSSDLNALRDYFRDIGRMVLAAEGRKANDSHADCYQYFCVPEYGTANGRLHFHAVHFMRTLPTGSVD